MHYVIGAVVVIGVILALIFDGGGCGCGMGTGSGSGKEEQTEKVVETTEEIKPIPEKKNLNITIADEDYLVDKKKVNLQSLIQIINEEIKQEGFSVIVVCERARANQYNALIKALKEVQAVYTTDGCD